MRPVAEVKRAGDRGGLTLLEVLIACALLILGLSTMAAILPAAGFRLAQAHLEDRASVLASNALAEVMNRRVIASDSFGEGAASALAFGSVLGTLPVLGALPSGRDASEHFAGLSGVSFGRCGSPRTFLLEDEVTYSRPADADTPTNSFRSEALGSGPRGCKAGVSWGAMLTPESLPARPGDMATLTIAIFKKADESIQPVPLALTRTNGFYEADITASGVLLRACTWVIAVPATPARKPEWFQIMSSWTLAPPAPQTTRLILRNQEAFETLTGATTTGGRATIIVFDGLVRVDQHRVTIN